MAHDVVLSQWTVQSRGQPVFVWPDGCRDLIIKIEPKAFPQIYLTTLDLEAYTIYPQPGTLFYGIRLEPGCQSRFALSSSPLSSLVKKIASQPDEIPGILLEVADSWFDTPDPLTADFLRAIPNAKGKIPHLIGKERTQRRLIRQSTGASPQFWLSLWRMRRAVQLVLSDSFPLSEIAFVSGYADQSHMTRDLRRWLGNSPAELRRQKNVFLPLNNLPHAFTHPLLQGCFVE